MRFGRIGVTLSVLLLLGATTGVRPFAALEGRRFARDTSVADLVLLDAFVYTVDSVRPRAEAIAIGGGRILYVGTNDSARSFIGPATEVLHLGGRMVLPGFQDTHVHPVTGGIELGECDLNAAATIGDVRRIVGECARREPRAAWVRGGGWALPIFPGANPSRALLDSLVPDRPAYLTAADGHSAWVNSRALALAGVTRGTRDPANGRIERDARGAPSGTLRESAAALVSRMLPRYTDADYLAGLERALGMARRFGITSWHEASASEAIARAYLRADSTGRLTARTIVSLHVDTHAPVGAEVQRLSALRARLSEAHSGLVRPVAAKIFMDGVIEAHTAALLAPYLDRPGNRGTLNVAPAKFDSLVHALDSAGFKVHVHAIGDRAVRVALDGFEKQHARDGGAGPRHIIAHIQLFDPADIPRFAQLGVVADFQPLWAYADDYITQLTEPILGPERSRYLYPIASVVKTGAIVAAGSDWSVSSMNPLEAIQVAVTRRAPNDSTSAGWLPQERVDLATMLRAYTLGGALASDNEAASGTLTAGKDADVIVLSDDLFALPAHRIARTRVLLTVMGGRVVYRDSTLSRDAIGRDSVLDRDGVRLRYRVEGSGPTVVLLHGFAGRLEDMDALATGLRDRFRVVRFDLRGFGASDHPHDPRRYGARLADDVIAVLDHLGASRATLVGYSLGAAVAASTAVRAPNRVAALVLIAGGPLTDSSRIMRISDDAATALETGRGLRPFFIALTPPGQQPPPDSIMGAISRAVLSGRDSLAWAAHLRGQRELAVNDADVRVLTMPTLLIAGTQDPLEAESRDWSSRLHAPFVSVKGASHEDVLARPQVGREVRAFLLALPSSSP